MSEFLRRLKERKLAIRIHPLLTPLHGDPPFEALAEKVVPARHFKASMRSALKTFKT